MTNLRVIQVRRLATNKHLLSVWLAATTLAGCAGDPSSSESGGLGGASVEHTGVTEAGGSGAKSDAARSTGGAVLSATNAGGASARETLAEGGNSAGGINGDASHLASGGAKMQSNEAATGGLSTSTRRDSEVANGGTKSSGSASSGSGHSGATVANSGSGGFARGGSSNNSAATGGLARGGSSNSNVASGGASRGGTSNSVATGGAARGGATSGSSTNTTPASGGSGGVSPCPDATQTLTVAADGSGQYKTVQAAINAIASNNSKQIRVSVAAGTYDEQVTINKPFVCLTGASATSTIITHTIDTNIVTGGTVLLTGNDFSAANITFQNSAPQGSAQRVALMAKGLRQQFYNCRFVSYQDTLYTNTGTQYFKDCYIQGNTDFIFGDATAVFDHCTIHSVAQGTAVTAPRTPQGTTYGFVFLGGSLTALSSVGTGRVHLGRPWGPYAAAAFINVELGSHIAAEGWTTMSNNTLQYTRFSEYKSTGAGANTTNATRASRQLTDQQAANYTTKNVLSPWVPGYSR